VHPTRRQTGDAVSTLLDELEQLQLTKAERLQVVNLAPTSLVELHVVRPPLPSHTRSTFFEKLES